MSLRLELQLFLWVTALLCLGAAIFHSNGRDQQLALIASDSEILPHHLLNRNGALDSREADGTVERPTPEPDSSSRTLFSVVPLPHQQPPESVVVAEAPRVLPILKGIVSSGAALRAIFILGPDARDYLTVGAGVDIGGYRILRILPDRVLARDEANEDVSFTLRGDGEAD
jgi:hypothetical protein